MTYDYAYAQGSGALTMSIDRISSDGYRPKESYERTSGNLYFEYAFNPVLNLDFQWLAYSSDLGVPGDERYWAGEPSDEHNQTRTELWSPRLRFQLSDEQEWRFLYTYTTNQLDVLDNAWGINGRYFERVHAFLIVPLNREQKWIFQSAARFEFGSPQLPSQWVFRLSLSLSG